jgi:thioredoxin 1
MSELEDLRKRKLEELKKRFSKGDKNMVENWPDTPIKVNDTNIDETVQKYNALVVDCWAPWCGPCNVVAPVIKDLAKEMQGKIAFAKLNVDENQRTSTKYQIMSIPTLLVFKNGNLVDRIVGALSKDALIQKLQPYQ